jgi:hypothetical protein
LEFLSYHPSLESIKNTFPVIKAMPVDFLGGELIQALNDSSQVILALRSGVFLGCRKI